MDIYSKYIDRAPVAAGRFYSAHAEKLEIEIEEMFKEAESLVDFTIPANDELMGIIAPHAGYVFSGIVAASAFMLLKKLKPRKRVFLIGSSHHTDFNGASIYSVGDYLTPFGKVKVDRVTTENLLEKSDVFEFVQAAHAHEHCLEVMLPFIQYCWKDSFEIIPVIIATHRKEVCKQIANELEPYFTSENLFVVSTDLSHYPSYNDAIETDKLTVNALITGKPEKFLEQIIINKETEIPNLSTSVCGWTSVVTLMYMAGKNSSSKFYPLLYRNSGDAGLYGDKDRVVGYQSIAFTQKKNDRQFRITESEKLRLLKLARQSITHYLDKKEKLSLKDFHVTENIKTACGAFVSLHIGEELRGCIGRLHAGDVPLYETVSEMAVSSAFYDSRFSPLSKDEISEINIEISILTPLQKISSIDEIEIGRHGIYLKKDYRTGTFLPQVAEKTNWTKEEFLGHCARDKAGIGWDGWKDADIYIYEAIIFNE